MKWLLAFVLALTLTGCSAAPVFETVEDFMPVSPVSTWQEEAWEISVDLPQEAQLTGTDGDTCLYEIGELEVLTSRFLAANLDDAVKQLSGFAPDRLNILQTTRFSMPEYQFAWYSQTAEGGRLCRADLVMDGVTCYAVVCTAPEDMAAFHDSTRQVFSTFGLNPSQAV